MIGGGGGGEGDENTFTKFKIIVRDRLWLAGKLVSLGDQN